jgi:hypothetical protein
MTFPAPQMPPAYGLAKPEKLSWVTIPLIVLLVLQVLGVLLLPLVLPFIAAIANAPDLAANADGTTTDPATMKLVLSLISGSIWVVEIFQIAFAALYFFTYRAVQQGKSWGRIAAIVLFILGLLNFPLGTLLGVFGLIGAFDAAVTAYCNK